jgi:hypothetical protein
MPVSYFRVILFEPACQCQLVICFFGGSGAVSICTGGTGVVWIVACIVWSLEKATGSLSAFDAELTAGASLGSAAAEVTLDAISAVPAGLSANAALRLNRQTNARQMDFNIFKCPQRYLIKGQGLFWRKKGAAGSFPLASAGYPQFFTDEDHRH